MKINKKEPKHWLYLFLTGGNVLLAIFVRVVFRLSNNKQIVFYGHTFNGNLKAFAEFIESRGEFDVYFATMDPIYYEELKISQTTPGRPLNLLNVFDMVKVARSGVVIADRKANVLELLNRYTRLPFVDVWHGIPYKGFTSDDFSFLKYYEEVWVSSRIMRELYINMYKVEKKKIKTTGYARVDGLTNGIYGSASIKDKYNISKNYEKIVLVAPTWQQDDKGRSIIPFGVSQKKFFNTMNDIGKSTNTLFIFRAHLNVNGADMIDSLSNVKNMPYALYPDVEEFLSISDILVTDWSSIAFDYLVLNRPTIFLDVDPPFRNGFSLGPEYRFGEIVNNIDDYKRAIESYVTNPLLYKKQHGAKVDEIIKAVYGDILDGRASQRQYNRIIRLTSQSKK